MQAEVHKSKSRNRNRVMSLGYNRQVREEGGNTRGGSKRWWVK
jgi:hypothetical protein